MSDAAVKLGADAITFNLIGYTIFVTAKANFLCQVIEFRGCADKARGTINNQFEDYVLFCKTRNWKLIDIKHIQCCSYFLPEHPIYTKLFVKAHNKIISEFLIPDFDTFSVVLL